MSQDQKDFREIEEKINIDFQDKNILKQAFTHRSFLNEQKNRGYDIKEHNERLEFLGDAVLELVVTEHLFHKYPEKPEGELTSLRAALVNTTSLSNSAHKIEMEDFLLLSSGEVKDQGKAKEKILADAFEALIGAVYLDRGYEMADNLISNIILPQIEEVIEKELWQDAKSKLQEMAQDKIGITPIYEVLDEKGPDHDKTFTVGVYFGEELVEKGDGKSKQEAEQNAASNALVDDKLK